MPAFPMSDMDPDNAQTNSDEMEEETPSSPMQLELRTNSRAVSELGPDSRASKYHKSRIFGQTHRNNMRLYEQRLARDIQELRREHAMLDSLLANSPHAQDWRAAPGSAYGPLAVDPARKFELSESSSDAVGAYTITARVALAMLEIIALRRNLIGWTRRRATGVRETSGPALENVLRSAKRGFQDEFEDEHDDARLYVVQQFHVLSEVHKNWAKHEGSSDASSDDEGGKHGEDVTIDPELVVFSEKLESRTIKKSRKGTGPRKCTRCGKLKNAGSGHGRSTCDDGVSVALNIPYPAPPGRGKDRMDGEDTKTT